MGACEADVGAPHGGHAFVRILAGGVHRGGKVGGKTDEAQGGKFAQQSGQIAKVVVGGGVGNAGGASDGAQGQGLNTGMLQDVFGLAEKGGLEVAVVVGAGLSLLSHSDDVYGDNIRVDQLCHALIGQCCQ